MVAQKYGVENTGFNFEKVCALQEYGSKDPKELREFINDIKNAAYTIERHMDKNLGQPEQEFVPDEFNVGEAKKGTKGKSQPER